MHLKPSFVLLSCLQVTFGTASFDTNYLRKMKKDKIGKDEALFSAEMFEAFDMSRGFGDWLDLDFANATTDNLVDEKDEELSDTIDLDKEKGGVDIKFEDLEEYEELSDTIQPDNELEVKKVDIELTAFNIDNDDIGDVKDNTQSSPFTESVHLGFDGLVPETTSAPTASENTDIDIAEEEDDVWNHGATAVSSRKSGTIEFSIPETTHVGDTVFLFLSRTDGVLPLNLPRWNRAAECFKSYNRQKSCMRAVHCIQRDGPYCSRFRKDGEIGNGKDLATVVYYRHVEEDDPCEWTLNLAGRTTTWAVVVSVPDVNRENPIQRVAGTSCDRKKQSIFPSVYGDEGNVVLLSQSFDDTALLSQFKPPQGTDLVGWTNDIDEAGFVYGKRLQQSGLTGQMVTQGNGGPLCKDALLSLIVNID